MGIDTVEEIAMLIREIMSENPKCCSPDASIQEAAQMMCENDCGAIPVVLPGTKEPVGIITDRDIACRAVAKGNDPSSTAVRACMTSHLAVAVEDALIEDCCEIMESQKLRRLLVVNRDGELLGIVAQADIARHLSADTTAEVVREVSEHTEEPSLVH